MIARIVSRDSHPGRLHESNLQNGCAVGAQITVADPEHPVLVAQSAYAERVRAAGFGFDLTMAEAFVRGIRDIGYRSTGTALDELVDNAVQADARTVIVAFNSAGSEKKPDTVAVIDDGHGMAPAMLRLAAVWGGTHREGDRTGFGRYGYGLPTACVSQGRRFTVYSRPPGGAIHSVTLDVDEIAAGTYRDRHGRVVIPAAQPAELPAWVRSQVAARLPGGRLELGTVVVIEKLDRLSRTTAAGLRRHLVDHFGMVYRNALSLIDLWVDDERVEPIDPLFLDPNSRFFDLDTDRARPLDPVEIDVPDRTTGQVAGQIRVRYSLLPTTFASIDKRRPAWGRNANARFPIMRSHTGIIFLRMGRQIDIVTRGPWAPFQHNDRYWNVEVDFPSSLDEEFGITTSKQQVEVSPQMWDILAEGGVGKAIDQLRRLNARARTRTDVMIERIDGDRLSTAAMEQSRIATQLVGPDHRPADPYPSGYTVRIEAVPGRPFFWMERVAGASTLTLNSAHPFFTALYAGPQTSTSLRSMLEILLFTFAESELDGSGNHVEHDRIDSPSWSARLAAALDALSPENGSALPK